MSLINEYIKKFEKLDGESFPQIEDFLEENLPVFECNDKVLEEIYYFRAYTFAKHVEKGADGRFYVTEWLNVPWKNEPISCAVGHHLSELKWFRNASRIAKDYILYWCENQE